MDFIKKSALAVLPLAFVLAGCNTVNKANAPAGGSAPAQATAAQGAAVDVFAASNAAIQGYRPVRLNNKQVIYISPSSVINRSHITAIDIAKDNQGRTYVKLTLNPQGVALINSVGKNLGYATAVGGQLASLTGVRQGNDFLFAVRDQQTASLIVRAVVPQQAKR